MNWNYNRFDLTEYLLEFRTEIELVFINAHFKEGIPQWMLQKNISIIYWSDYASPYDLLEKINPSIVVFSDLEAFNQIALNIAARNRGIKTFILQHGFRGAYEIDEALASAQQDYKIRFSNTSAWSMRFLIRALRINNLKQLPRLVRFVYDRKKNDLTTALYNNHFELRRADFYIEFSEDNCTYHQKRDGISRDRFIISGNPLLDNYFDYLNKNNNAGDYCLLIDCPFVEANFYQDHGISPEKKNEYLRKLDAWSAINGYRLKVKLHPLSYHADDLYKSNNIEYIRDGDLKELVANCAMVYFVHFSTVAPVILYYKTCIYFHSIIEEHSKIFSQLGITEMSLFSFDETMPDLLQKAIKLNKESLMTFLFSTDGKAAERVKHALVTHS